MKSADGHAVRALYYLCGVADLARETQDGSLLAAAEKLADDVLSGKTYVTGGAGSVYFGERFSTPYELPNETAYAETCASIALVFFADRMFRLTGEKKYADVIERALYNGVLSGVSLDGTAFFYVNPLEVITDRIVYNDGLADEEKRKLPLQTRAKVFDCSCCPPNICRFIADLPEYIWNIDGNTLILCQYITSVLDVPQAEIRVESDFPYSGKVKLNVDSAGKNVVIKLRKPEWCDVKFENERDGFLVYDGVFDGKEIEIDFSMQPKRCFADPRVAENVKRAALTYGPSVLCAESCDNGPLCSVCVPLDEKITVTAERESPYALSAAVNAKRLKPQKRLYAYERPEESDVTLKLIPYFAWANRGRSDLKIWFPY